MSSVPNASCSRPICPSAPTGAPPAAEWRGLASIAEGLRTGQVLAAEGPACWPSRRRYRAQLARLRRVQYRGESAGGSAVTWSHNRGVSRHAGERIARTCGLDAKLEPG